MIWNPFKSSPNGVLGIDIGTSAIKIVELSRHGDRIKLENYGEVSAMNFFEKPFRTSDKNSLLLSSQDIARAIKAIFEEAGISGKKAIFSIPDFSTFFIDFTLPPMTEGELPDAVKFEARQYIPMPLSEVTLDWSIIEGQAGDKKQKGTSLKILLVAVPTEIINQYREIASLSKITIKAVEAEAFGLLRALVRDEKRTVCVLDIGAQSTTVNIADKGILKKSHSFDVSGSELTEVISKSLNVSSKEAELLKMKKGLDPSESIRPILLPLVDYIVLETEKICKNFYQSEGKEIEKIILAGGSAKIPGLKKYFLENLKTETEIGNPFENIFYPPILEDTVKEMGSSYAIAVGMAQRGLEK